MGAKVGENKELGDKALTGYMLVFKMPRILYKMIEVIHFIPGEIYR